jgi:hypothetical protein
MHSTVSETQGRTQRAAAALGSELAVKTFAIGPVVALPVEFAGATLHPVSITFTIASAALRAGPGLWTEGTQHCFSSRPEGVLATSY